MIHEERLTRLRDKHRVCDEHLDHCVGCGQPWACDAAHLLEHHGSARTLLAQALAALIRAEWSDAAPHYCDNCISVKHRGHRGDCLVGNAIAALRAAGVEPATQGGDDANV